MAKVYSWEVSKNPRKYSYIIHPYDTEKTENPETGEPRAYVGSELEGENLENVKNWTINCTDEEYEVQFNKMVQLCKDKDYTVEFESVGSYLDVTESCDNLRGPEGRGIDKITTDYSGTEYTIYTIHYTDGTTYSFTVHNGKDGKNGEDGKNGNPGDSGVSSRQVTIYITSEEKPDTPVGGNYDFVNYKLTCPEGWYPNCDELKAPIWMSSRTFATSPASTDNNWTEAIKITGDSGKPGVDGITTEFIYCRQDTEPETPKPNENAQDTNGKFPNQSGYVPTDWTGSPKGIDEGHKTEWCSTRNKTTDEHGTPTWGTWGRPFRWARWGVDGKDGDGVQYIYLLAEEKYTPVNPTPSDWADDNSEYQNPNAEWIPEEKYDGSKELENGIYTNKWYDSPLTVTMNYPHLWVSVRKYTYDDEEKEKMWGEYSNPSLFAKFGQDGKSATYIRKIYRTTDGTDDVPQVPKGSNSASDIDVWSLSFPSDYENGVNVVWATEAEASAADNTFVYHYKRISTTTDDGEKLPEEYKDKENLFFEYAGESVPDEKVHDEDTHKGIKVDGKYYIWSGGWCPPYLVTGVKGDSAAPINYTTYVFAYGYSDSTPGVPTGNSIENLGASQDGFGRPIYWEDAPTVEKTIEGTNDTIYREEGAEEELENGEKVIRRWYQCVGYVNSKDNNSVKWGAVVPLYAKDGEAGKDGSYVEYRFFVTEGEEKPTVVSRDEYGKPIRVPYTIVDKQPKQWLTIDDAGFDSNIPSGGAMWQMWTYITKAKTTSKPEEPSSNPDDNSESGEGNTSGGNIGTNGDGTGSNTDGNAVEVVDTNGTNTDGEGTNGNTNNGEENGENKEDNNNSNVDNTTESISEWYGPIRISGERGKTGERGPAGLRGVTGIPGANYIQMYCLGTTSKEVKRYDFNSIDSGYTKFSDGYFGGIYKDGDGISILPEKLEDWCDSKNIPDSTVLKCYSEEELKTVINPANIGRVCVRIENEGKDNETHIYYLITRDYEENDKSTPSINKRKLTGELSKFDAENFNIYTWCLQGIETWTEGQHKGYVELSEKPNDSDDSNTKEVTALPDKQDQFNKYLKIKQITELENEEVIVTYKYYEWQEFEGDEVVHEKSITWGPPFKLQGADGLKGKDGTRGQMIYPMGVYNPNEVYVTTEEKAPYVYDASDGMFYVYNMVGVEYGWVGKRPDNYKEVIVHPQDAKESNTEVVDNVPSSKVDGENVKYIKLRSSGNYYVWNGKQYEIVSKYKYSMDGTNNDEMWYTDQNGNTPSSNYSNNTNNNTTPAWVRFESFQALYTSLGIIENGLIGSAVYNNEFMYSQYGINNEEKPVSYADVASQGTDYGFLSGYEYDEDKKQWKDRNGKDYIDKYKVDPYKRGDDGKYIHTFMPNVCINFLTGQMWLSTGKAFFNYDGTGHLASEAIKWEYEENDPNRLKLTIGDSNNQGIELSIDKYETLNKLFGATVTSGAVLTGFLGIRNEKKQIVAALDGSGIAKEKQNHGAYVLIDKEDIPDNDIDNIYEVNSIPDTQYRTYIKYIGEDGNEELYYKWTIFYDRSIILASGMVYSNDTEDLGAVMESAKTKIYSDGTFETKQGVFEGNISARTGEIGGLEINEDGFSHEYTDENGWDNIFNLHRKSGLSLEHKFDKNNTKYNTIVSLSSDSVIKNGQKIPHGLYCESYDTGNDDSLITVNNKNTAISTNYYTNNVSSTMVCDGLRLISGIISGLRPRLRTITSTNSDDNNNNKINVQLSEYDHTIIIKSKATINILLPQTPINAQEYYIFTIKKGIDDSTNYNCYIIIKDPQERKVIYELHKDRYQTQTILNDSNTDNHFIHIVYAASIPSTSGLGTWVVRYDTN